MLALERYRQFAAEHGQAQGLGSQEKGSGVCFAGGLAWAGPGESLRSRHDHEQRIGYPSRWVDADQVAGLAPGADPGAVAGEGAIFNPDEGWADLPTVITTLLAEFVELGGELITETGSCRVDRTGDRVRGVITGNGRSIPADAVLLATGAATPALTAELGFTLPEQTPIAALARARPTRGPAELRVVLNTPRVSLRPTPAGNLVMDSAWSEREVALADGGYRVETSTIERLLGEARTVLAGHPELELLDVGCGPKPIPGDGEPVLGPLPGVAGCWVAFTHSGATLGLIAGELLAAEITGAAPSPLLADFRPSRFAG